MIILCMAVHDNKYTTNIFFLKLDFMPGINSFLKNEIKDDPL